MTNPTPVNDDLQRGRGWLNNAADVLSGAEDTMSSAEYARIAATLGAGFVALAHAERAAASSATLDAAAERVRRAAAEARPHADAPLPFLGFTRDGHPVGGPVPDDVPQPDLVARCGGPGTCRECAADAARLHGRADAEQTPEAPRG